MNLSLEKLKEARDAGIPDDVIWEAAASAEPKFNELKNNNIPLDVAFEAFQGFKPVETSFTDKLQTATEELEMTIADIPLALGEAFSGLTKTAPASFYAAKEGLARPDQYSKEALAAFDTQREYFKQLEQQAKTREAEGKSTAVGEAIRGAGQSLGFTVAGMAPAIAGGAAAGAAASALFPPAASATIPIGAIAGGIGSMVASAPVSYRMAGGQFLYDAFKSLEESKGSPLTEEEKTKAYNELLPIAQNTALWEAGPEAIGNAVQLGALKYAFGFGKKAATNVAGQAIQKANDTLLKKVGAVAGGQVVELAGETITQTQQGADQAKMEQYVQTGSTAGAPDEYQGLAGAVKAFKEVAPTTLALGAITAGAGGAVKVVGMGGKQVGKVLFSKPKTPEQIAEDQINDAANRVANDLSISPDDTQANNLNQQIKALSEVQEIRKQTLAAIEPTSREAQTLKLDIAEGESMLGELNQNLTKLTGLSEPITEAERQQAELAKAIVEEPAPTVKESLTVQPTQVAPAPAPAEQVVTPPVEVAPAPAIEEEPMSVSDEKEFAELNGLMERKGQAENKVRGVKFTKQDQSRYQNLVTKFRDRLIETTDPKNDPVVGTDINGTPIQQSNKGTFYTFENGRVRTGPAFSEATPAPTIAEAAPVEPITPAPVTEQVAPAAAPAPEVAPDRLYLNVPFQRKEGVKLYGAKFDPEKKLWYLERNQAGKFPLISPSFVQEAEATSRSAKELEPARINAQNKLGQEVEISPFQISTGTAYGLKVKGGDWINKNINLEIERAKTKVEPIAGGGTEMATMESQPSTPGGISPDQKSRDAGTALAKAYPFKGIQTQTEEKRFLAKAKESLKKLGVKAWEFDSSVERLKTRKARESGGRITYVNDRSIYLQLITDGFLAQPTAVEPTPAVSETITEPVTPTEVKTTTEPTKTSPVASTSKAAGDVVNEIERVVDIKGVRAAKQIFDKVIQTLESLVEESKASAGFQTVEFRPSAQKKYGLGTIFIDGEYVASVGKYGDVRPNEEYELKKELPSSFDIRDLSPAKLKQSIELGVASKIARRNNKNQKYIVRIPGDGTFKIESNPIAVAEVIRRIKTNGPSAWKGIYEPKLGEKGGVLIPTKEDFIQAGQNIYEAGMEFGAWAKQMIQRFGDAVREFLGEVWQAVSGAPAKFNELMGYLPGKGEAGAVNVGKGKIGEKAKPAEKPAEEAKVEKKPAVEAEPDKEQIKGEKIGPPKKTPEGIIAKTQELLRKQFDPSKVSEKNTTEAFRAIGRLTSKQGNTFAEELNDLGRVEGSEVSMGAALFVNDLFEYSIRLAAEGDSKMLGIMMANINRLPTAMIGASDAGRTLAARAELKARFSMMGRAEQDAYTNYVAEFIYGPNPTKEQIQSIKDAYAAVDKTEPITEQELTDEITAVGDRTRTDLVGKINDEFTKATEKGKEKRRTEEQELDKEYKKIQKQADAEIEKLAKIQSDTPSFDPAVRQIINEVRAIVANDLKQRPDMESKADWKSALIAKLQQVGVEPAAAGILADIVWRQHEINSLSRELASINKAIEKGPISEIVKAIKDTPLEDQQNPNWRYEVMRDYLRKAGLNVAQSERIAKLMDISLQKRFTMAQEQAFTDAISKSAPWKTGDTRSRRAFQKVLQALRAGALDPARNVLSDMAALNGWTGFTPEQYKALLKNDAILSDPESADATKAEAHKAIQDIISKAKLPIRARDVIGQFYDAQALSGIPTMTVNIFSPAGMAVKNALTQSLNGVLTARPEQITASLTTFIDSIKSWANTVAFSFKNNVTVYSNVEYLVNDEGLLKLYKRGVDQFNKGKTPRERADGVKNMMIGMMDYVRRVLNALDYGAIASLQNQAVSKYALAAMQAKGMSSKDGAKMLNAMMEQKRIFYNDQIAIGTDKNKAAVLADEFFISSWRQALTDAKLPAQQVMDAALNDAMSAVGRNRQSLDAFREEETNTRDGGVISYPALWLLETMANAANKADNQVVKLFSRMIYGFAVVPARVFRETAWFSPYGAVRFAYDYIAKKMGKTSPYAQSLGNDLQYRQRLTETITGSIVMLAFAAAMSSSTEDEEDEKPFKIVVTGNGPLRSEDPQYYDSWTKKHKANTVSVYFGKTKFTINTMRGFEAFAWPAMMLGAVDDWQIRRKQKRETNTPMQMGDAAIIGGFVLSASLRRGPYAFAAKPLFEAYGDRGVESLAKSLAFPAKTLVPVLGASLARNLSDFLNEPVDRKTLEGALWSNVPFIGPAVSPKSLNAFGEPALANEAADKIFKLGVPITFNIPTDRDSVNLHELVLKQGGGPSIPTRNQLAQRLDRQPTNKEYEMFVKEYGAKISSDMKRRYEELSNKTPEKYSKSVEKIGNRARDIAERKVREAAKKP
jgi:hypothetical protein